uniref:WW-binding domain-containing protein n=1 Tax=Loxodonta africana TaxID=9785 RepID=G3TLM5_LOXAF
VRKSSQEVLLILLEQDLIFQHDIENKVCPLLLHLSAADSNDEYKAEAVNIICKMAPMLSKSTVVRLLLPRFCELCGDRKLFQVRKVCATNFGDICCAVGQEATEKFLIPKFFELCSDNVWGMRKACAECFMAVSYTTSPEVRRARLSPLFIRLISDPCRWVRQAAFQSLGPFISTFANPSRAGLYIREGSCADTSSACQESSSGQFDISAVDLAPGGVSSEDGAPAPLDLLRSAQGLPPPIPPSSRKPVQREPDVPLEDRLPRLSPGPSAFSKLPDLSDRPANSHPGPGSSACPGSPEDVFSNLLYWQTPLPDISKDLELLLGKAGQQEDICCGSKTVPSSCVPSSEIRKVLDSLQEDMMNDPDIQAQVQVLSAALRAAQLDSENASESQPTAVVAYLCLSLAPGMSIIPNSCTEDLEGPDKDHDGTSDPLQAERRHNPTPHEENKSKLQDIIPQPLLDQYVSMTDPARAQTVDTDIAKHCAYSLPGVALALGRQNWHCLKDTYETLASDVQWKVRRTLAFSIHELAVILGDQLTAADLVPIFNGFLKDLDEVRIGVLKHLYDFLKLLHADKRREYLYQLQEFVVTDNNRNWRFRYELAEQLILILELYNPQDVYDYLTHIALKLCADKVSEVRWISFRLAVAILHKFYSHSQSALGLNFINELIVRFRHCPKWVGRQAFAFICQAAVSEECVPVDQFVEHLLPSLLSLASDPVPNVRVLLAKALKQTLLEKAYFRNVGNPHLKVVEETVLALQSDRDQDVSFFATLEP